MIHQEMSLVPSMTVVDNVFLGRERTRAGLWMAHRFQRERARALVGQLGLDVDLARPVEEYPVSVRQMIEIAKALVFEARIIVMDEPTSALNDPEVERLFAIIDDLKRRGCGIIYISHRMEEIYKIADRITVLRDGEHVGTARRGRRRGVEGDRARLGPRPEGAGPLDGRPRDQPAVPGENRGSHRDHREHRGRRRTTDGG